MKVDITGISTIGSAIKVLFICIVVIFLTLSAPAIITGCRTYKPVWIDELPDECNMTLNAYKIYYNTEDKSATVGLTDACLKKLHREYCRVEVFGVDLDGNPNPVDYNDVIKYRNFSQCLAEIK